MKILTRNDCGAVINAVGTMRHSVRVRAYHPCAWSHGITIERAHSNTRISRAETKHLWLPESSRLVQRSAILGPLSYATQRDWLSSLDPTVTRPGRRVEPDRRNWGVKGVACLLKAGRECVSAAKVFWDLIASLERAGYQAGETLFGVPFDWRFSPTENHFCADLARMLHTVTNRTSYRKAFLVAHSLGNLQILHCIQRVFGLETTSKIKALVSIAAPWAGARRLLACW